MSTSPSSLAARSVSVQLSLAGLRGGVDGGPACLPRFGRQAVVGRDPIGPEGVERPVLEEDLDRPPQCGGTGREDGGGLELVVGAGEEHDRDGFVHAGVLSWLSGWAAGRRAACGRSAARGDDFGRRASGGGRDARETAHEDAAHRFAGADDLRVAQPIADLAAVALRLDDARGAHQRQMLGDVRLADAHFLGQPADLAGTVGEEVDDLQPPRVRERLQDFRLELVDLVHAVQCWIYAQVRIGTGVTRARAKWHGRRRRAGAGRVRGKPPDPVSVGYARWACGRPFGAGFRHYARWACGTPSGPGFRRLRVVGVRDADAHSPTPQPGPVPVFSASL